MSSTDWVYGNTSFVPTVDPNLWQSVLAIMVTLFLCVRYTLPDTDIERTGMPLRTSDGIPKTDSQVLDMNPPMQTLCDAQY